MTIGEKIKEARKSAGMTQEELAEKLMVSRQAVTKWEADKGIPDIQNLKAISNLLNVSIDYLLNDGQALEKSVIKETVDLSLYGGRIKAKTNLVREKYKDAEIYMLIATQKLEKSERIIDNIIGIFTDVGFGVPDVINSVKNVDDEYFLVNKGEKQYLVKVTKEFIESREMIEKIDKKKFEIGNLKFKRVGKNINEKV